MKTTKICQIHMQGETERHHLDRLMTVFCSAVRYSFNRLLEHEKTGDLIKKVNLLFRINKRYAEDAVMQAQAVLSSQKELLPTRIEGVQLKIGKSEKKLEDYQTGKKTPKKVPVEVCIKGLEARLEKLRKKEAALLNHQEKGTIPPVLFGGKKNFHQRMKGKLSNEEWKDLRSNTLYARGDRSKKGNANLRITFHEEEQQFYLEVANPLLTEEGKTKAPRLLFPLRISDKHFDEIVKVVMPDVVGENAKGKPIESYRVYSIELKRKNGKYYVHITYDVKTHGSVLKWNEKINADRIAGIDVNVDRIAISVLTKQGNLLKSKTFYCHEMEYVSSHKRSNLAGETAKEITEYLIKWNVGAIVLEDLSFKQDHDTNKRLNRLTHQFAKTKLQKAIIARGLKFGFRIKKVNPAYTSVIGRFKYSKRYGLSVHEATAFVIGRRGLDFEEKIPKQLVERLCSLVKPHLISLLGSMEESEKRSKNGKQRSKYIGMMLSNMETFQEHHRWKLWNVIHKTLFVKNQELQLKEV
ncbi:IS200/IS605 family accessory protein TnpB-related protein [Bacillus taeanensis]|uniref:Transposase n=1 Tax=Bacillus taeanensis TaxID=273032 RepID=A0A366XNV2_9BACI|nr:IS200/IS605 family accessory protein TnpB-related protein [Bacillus taeanensis]RBW67587.1 transposase [Bacillus taeanensis]